MRASRRRKAAGVVAATVVATASWMAAAPSPAHACGGFFCGQQRMDQAGERIVFSVEQERVRAAIRIDYAGEAEDFAWVLPMPAAPDTIELGSSTLFQQLQARTAPRYRPVWQSKEGCYAGPPREAAGGTGGGANDGGVEVVDQKSVGPYDTVTVTADDAGQLLTWLNDNGFEQPDATEPLLAHYIELDMAFVAMKLKQGATTGAIQPIAVTFQGEQPCVPLALTRIAAEPDMPVLVWMLGDHRAVPTNWFHVEINPAKIDWLDWGSNYREVATQAIDEAAEGHGFVTEFAGPHQMSEALYREGQFDTEALKGLEDPAAFIDEMLAQGFPRGGRARTLIREHVPKPAESELPEECRDDNSYYTPSSGCLDEHFPEDATFDPEAFVEALKERVIEPLQSDQAMLDAQPYLTRLFSTVSPDEMTRDPVFSFNPDLPEVSNTHTADVEPFCNDEGEVEKAVLTLPNGEEVTVEDPDVGFGPGGGDGGGGEVAPGEPAAARVTMMNGSGPPEELAAEEVAQREAALQQDDPHAFALLEGEDREGGDEGTPTGGPDASGADASGGSGGLDDGGGGGGCRGGAPVAPLGPIAGAVALVGLALRRRTAEGRGR